MKKYILLEQVIDSLFYEAELDPLCIEKFYLTKNYLFSKEFQTNTSDSFIKQIETNRKTNLNYFLKNKRNLKYSPDFVLGVVNQNTKKQSLNTLFPPNMSGYKYPDMNLEKVKKFQFNSVYNSYSYKNQNIPLKIILTDNPLVFINTFLEQKAISSPAIQKTPLVKNKNLFFGINFPITNEIESSSNLDLLNKKLLKNDSVKVILADQDPNGWFFAFNKEINENSQFTPNHDLFSFIPEKQKNMNRNQIHNRSEMSEKINIKFLPISETSVQEILSNPQKIEILYKRIPHLTNFDSNWNSFLFYNLWEPITQDSWLITAQFLSGALIFRIVKDLYQEYGKEMLSYVFQFAASLGIDIDELKDQYLSNDKEKGYRIISRVKKGFNDIAGIDGILPQIGEIVWFLRNSGRSVKLKNTIPKGILLVGPPGTGKTLLVQAIAGEAQVPILVESGSLLSDPQKRGQAVQRLKTIFTKARDLAPCIIFIDEVDTLGEKRQQLIQNPMGEDNIVESIYEHRRKVSNSEFILKPKNLLEESNKGEDIEYEIFRESADSQSNKELQEIQQSIEAKKSRRSLLMQFLVELDGLQSRNGVLVIGATNRPSVLDPALIRPGRFDLVISLELPSKQKRIQILKLYSEKLKFDKKISWNYLSDRTIGFSAADLAAIMNESSIQAILGETTHTIETIEKGIDLVTSYNSEKVKLIDIKQLKNNFSITRLSFYQAGKGVLHTTLKNHPSSVVLYLWPRQKNARHINNVFSFTQNSSFNITTKLNLETQLVGLYAGKASEILSLFGMSHSTNFQLTVSNLGLDDISSASLLANTMIEKWYFYSKETLINREQNVEESKNENEFTENENLQILSTINKSIENELEFEKLAKIARSNRYQQWSFQPWWQIQITKQISDLDSSYADWYRIYLPNPEESTLNIEWVLPDTYYHANIALKSLSANTNVSINKLYKIKKDYIYHGLILNSFNKAFSILDQNREFLDYFTDYLLRYEIIRQDSLKRILVPKNLKSIENSKKNQKRKVEKKWGVNSRRKFSRVIDFRKLIKE